MGLTIIGSFLTITLAVSIIAALLPILFWSRFVAHLIKWFSKAVWAFALLVLAFTIFFVTELLEIYDIPETMELTLNMLSTLLILGGQISIITLFRKGR